MAPFYRSDSMYLERLHWEAALDRTPEDVAATCGDTFSGRTFRPNRAAPSPSFGSAHSSTTRSASGPS